MILLATLALAGCGTISSRPETGNRGAAASLGQPIATVTTSLTSPSSTAAHTSTSATTAGPESIRLPRAPAPTAPRSRAILRVATRFTRGYLLYQIGRVPRTVRQTIRSTSTPSFARLLLSQRVNVPSADRSSAAEEPSALVSVTYTGPATLAPGPPVQIVVARYDAIAHPHVTGQLTIELTAARGGWLVTSLR
jgi:hypothetical protein